METSRQFLILTLKRDLCPNPTKYGSKNFGKPRKDETLDIAALLHCCFNEFMVPWLMDLGMIFHR